jgi:hypothetical protein
MALNLRYRRARRVIISGKSLSLRPRLAAFNTLISEVFFERSQRSATLP